MTAESLSPRNGGSVGLLLGAGVAMERSIGFHLQWNVLLAFTFTSYHYQSHVLRPLLVPTNEKNKQNKQTQNKKSNKCTYSFINIFKKLSYI